MKTEAEKVGLALRGDKVFLVAHHSVKLLEFYVGSVEYAEQTFRAWAQECVYAVNRRRFEEQGIPPEVKKEVKP